MDLISWGLALWIVRSKEERKNASWLKLISDNHKIWVEARREWKDSTSTIQKIMKAENYFPSIYSILSFGGYLGITLNRIRIIKEIKKRKEEEEETPWTNLNCNCKKVENEKFIVCPRAFFQLDVKVIKKHLTKERFIGMVNTLTSS